MAKYRDKEWLETELVDKGRSVESIANECGVKKGTIEKWRNKLSVGERYECDYCEEDFPTERGRNIHHKKSHDTSTGGFTYECELETCSGEFESPRPPDDPKAPSFCSQECYGKSIEGERNPNRDPERAKKISETMKEVHREGRGDYGARDSQWMIENVINERDDSYLHDSPNPDEKEKISETHRQIAEEGEHHLQNPSVRKKITQSRDYSSPISYEVEETGHIVDSSWEEDVDLLLSEMEIDYQYNSEDGFPTFELDDGIYTPDFQVGDSILIEVKGELGYFWEPEKTERIAEQMTEKDDITYIVYGSVDLQSDIFVKEGDLEQLRSILLQKTE